MVGSIEHVVVLVVAAAFLGGTVAVLRAATRVSACCLKLRSTVALLLLPVLAVVSLICTFTKAHQQSLPLVFAEASGPALVVLLALACGGRFLVLERERRGRERAATELVLSAAYPIPAFPSVMVVPSARDVAFALSGSRLVVLSETVAARPPAEVETVLAHEQAHLRGRHHLFVQMASSIAWLLPNMRRRTFVGWVRVCVEASADCAVRRKGLGEALVRVRTSWVDPDASLLERGKSIIAQKGSGVIALYAKLVLIASVGLFWSVWTCLVDVIA